MHYRAKKTKTIEKNSCVIRESAVCCGLMMNTNKNPYLQQCSLNNLEEAFADLEIVVQMAYEDDDQVQMWEVFYYLLDIREYICHEEILCVLDDRRIYKKYKETPEKFLKEFYDY